MKVIGKTESGVMFEGTVESPFDVVEMRVATHCIICGDLVELSDYEAHGGRVVKVCENCKKAIQYAREQLEKTGGEHG